MKSSNNIDKLFADKLSSLESTPSADAWMNLQKGLQQKNKKKPIWLPYSVAAAMLLLILSGVLLRKQFTDEGSIAIDKPPVEEQVSPQEKQTIPAQPNTEKNNQIAQQQQNNPAENISQPDKTELKSGIQVTPEPKPKKEKQSKTAIKPAPGKQPVELRQAPAIQETVAIQETIPMPETTLALANPEASTIVVTVQLDEPQVAEESAEMDEPDSPAKQGKAARLLDKLRKLKKGEFDELGLNKQNLVALVKVNSGRSHQDKSRE
ncbi:hypothetical protein GXP67_07270 [Rhodocytophaga rosea]|uniref:Uncharacterized protein n=1 Tax=Rhodocytophaga rosea TaxID=2704465 RepID=A0A6C0GEN1_9BACT|nr:hypothetical protein [Rhodocytophaga rosea]QHT66469.1 hypothetical protein GXP67_07270 [Rhodocytophaga rosea]